MTYDELTLLLPVDLLPSFGVDCGEWATRAVVVRYLLARTPPADLRWALDWPGGDIAARQSAAIIAASVRRIARGLGPIEELWSARVNAQRNSISWRKVAPGHDTGIRIHEGVRYLLRDHPWGLILDGSLIVPLADGEIVTVEQESER